MKKILEVLRYGNGDIIFKTDVDPLKKPEEVNNVLIQTMMSMATKLWGGNEQAVLAMIRVLSIADLALSVNRKEMIRWLDRESGNLYKAFQDASAAFKKEGGKIMTFGPGVMPPKTKS
ncbi:MAG: hypothetical protein J5907_04250 [Bacteroidales bacterium]|nr:hypothetical protein [Bacteroidales bacterium]